MPQGVAGSIPAGNTNPPTGGFSVVCQTCPGGAILADAVVSEATAERQCEFESHPGHQNPLQTGVSIVCTRARMAELADALGLGSSVTRREGSNPFPGTNSKRKSNRI